MHKLLAVAAALLALVAVPRIASADGSDSSETHSYTSTCEAGRIRFTNTSESTSTGDGVLVFRVPGSAVSISVQPHQSGLLDPATVVPSTPWEAVFFDSGQPYVFDGGTFGPCLSSPTVARSLAATPGASGQARLTWYAPASNGGTPITDYVIQRTVPGTSNWTTINDGIRATTGYTVTGLTNGTRYYFRIYARNAAGTSPASTSATTIPRTVPSAPAVRATAGANQVTVSWSPGSTGGAPITRYAIQRSTNPSAGWAYVSTATASTARSFTSTGLRNGVRYYFRVVAINAAGVGQWSAAVSAVPVAPVVTPPPRPGCDPSYPTVCIPPAPPDLDCGDISYRRFRVVGSDPHRFDADRDGVGCESG